MSLMERLDLAKTVQGMNYKRLRVIRDNKKLFAQQK